MFMVDYILLNTQCLLILMHVHDCCRSLVGRFPVFCQPSPVLSGNTACASKLHKPQKLFHLSPPYLPICGIYLPFQVNLYVPNSKPSNKHSVLYARIAHVSTRVVYIFHARWIILKRSGLRLSLTRKWLVTGMPSPMLKSNQNNCKQNSPRIVVSWRHPLFRASHGLMLVGGGGV